MKPALNLHTLRFRVVHGLKAGFRFYLGTHYVDLIGRAQHILQIFALAGHVAHADSGTKMLAIVD